MSFEPASPISILVCDQCSGRGCPACDQLGIYATRDNQPVGFLLPDFIDLKARKLQRNIFLIKRAVLLTTILLIFLALYAAFGR